MNMKLEIMQTFSKRISMLHSLQKKMFTKNLSFTTSSFYGITFMPSHVSLRCNSPPKNVNQTNNIKTLSVHVLCAFAYYAGIFTYFTAFIMFL